MPRPCHQQALHLPPAAAQPPAAALGCPGTAAQLPPLRCAWPVERRAPPGCCLAAGAAAAAAALLRLRCTGLLHPPAAGCRLRPVLPPRRTCRHRGRLPVSLQRWCRMCKCVCHQQKAGTGCCCSARRGQRPAAASSCIHMPAYHQPPTLHPIMSHMIRHSEAFEETRVLSLTLITHSPQLLPPL